MTAWFLLLGSALVVANAFFVAVEFALIASRRSALEPLAVAGDRRARRALRFTTELNLQLAASQLGITMASLGLGAIAEPAVASVVESAVDGLIELPESMVQTIGFVVAISIVVLAHLVVGEMVPKSIAITAPERTLLRLAGLNRAYVAVFRPVIRLLTWLADSGTRAVGVEPRDELAVANTAEDLARLLARSREAGLLADTAHDLLAGALFLGGRDLRSVLVPPDQVVAVPRTATVAEVEAVVVETGVSRLLVQGPDGAASGFIHAKDLLTVPAGARQRPVPLARIRRVLVLEDTLALGTVLVAMRRSRIHLAAVVDRERRFVGLATLEDVLESVVGDIVDESDSAA